MKCCYGYVQSQLKLAAAFKQTPASLAADAGKTEMGQFKWTQLVAVGEVGSADWLEWDQRC